MSDAPDHNDDDVLAGEYALGLLPADAAAQFEARLASEPALRATLAQWAEDLASLTNDIAPVTPPARVERQIAARLFGSARKRGLMARMLPWGMGAAVAALAVLMLVMPPQGIQPPADPVYHADLASEDRSLIVAAGYDATTSELYVERRAGTPAPGRAQELWLIAGDAAPVSLGLLPDDSRARLPISPNLRAALEGGVLAISDEPPGGSPTGQPTGAVLAVGPLTTL